MTTILIIDDYEGFTTIAQMFNSSEIHIIIAKSGAEGLEKFKKEGIDIVFIDLQLPDMSGVKVFREIESSDAELIMITGTKEDKELDLLKVQGVRVIAKPFSIGDFIKTL